MQAQVKAPTKSQINQIKWSKLAAKLTVWVASELLLGWTGLDNLADYGEFILGESALYQSQYQPQVCFQIATPDFFPELAKLA